jgi:hypothetical protein
MALTSSCETLESWLRNPNYIYEDGAVLVDGNNKPIELKSRKEAVNVTYAELKAFLRKDLTDLIPYVERDNASGEKPFVCSDFAEAVHNNAELAGIRAGYVSIDWMDGTIGHAVNAFETTDSGQVFIDCTGRSAYSQLEDGGSSTKMESWDKVAYVEIGKKYGVIGLDDAEYPYYFFFEDYDQKWQELKEKLAAYNAEVKQYNQEIAGKVYRKGSAELARIEAWDTQLRLKEKEISVISAEVGTARFRPLGTVKNYNVHW